jgi:plasmid stabilization system protein ParE
MACLVVFSQRAESWVERELLYLREHSPPAARQLIQRLAAARETLADFPQSGPRSSVPGTRRLIMLPYVLSYREIAPDLVVIIDIRHRRQRPFRSADEG